MFRYWRCLANQGLDKQGCNVNGKVVFRVPNDYQINCRDYCQPCRYKMIEILSSDAVVL